MTEPRTVLVVDDDPMLRDLLVQTLTAIGHESVAASDGFEALEQLKQRTFDVVISDIKMPNMDGIQLLKEIRAAHESMPVLFISGFATSEMIQIAQPDGFLTKPFRIHQVEDLIARVTSPNRSRS